MASLVHFEIVADQPERAARFYNEVFGWESKKWGEQDYWLIDTKHGKKPGIDGAITTRIGLFAKKGGIDSYVCTIEVENLKEAADKIQKFGGKKANEGNLIPGVGNHQYFFDTEGNLFGCLEPDKNPKMPPM